ncbi:MAG: hypothetical protein MUD16_07675 [Desulfobacterales bacterium]|jgi:hypothetical protein|nr:hypothetical protein [Desulfobacterales bacterium]
MPFFPTLLPAAVLLGGVCLLFAFYREIRQRRLSAALRRPVPPARSVPGQAILAEIDRINQEIGDYTHGSLAFLVLFVGVVVAAAAFADPPSRPQSSAWSGGVGVVFFGMAMARILRLTQARKEHQRRYNGRIEVARALNALAPDGYRVYHDVPGEGFSLHHVAAGPHGVFAVHTSSGKKPPRSTRVEDATVAYNGHALFFPRWSDDHTIGHAEARAQWLSERLERAIGEAVAVRAVVAVPGWFVKRTTPEGIPVVHPGQVASLFKFIAPRPISGETLDRILQHLDHAAR